MLTLSRRAVKKVTRLPPDVQQICLADTDWFRKTETGSCTLLWLLLCQLLVWCGVPPGWSPGPPQEHDILLAGYWSHRAGRPDPRKSTINCWQSDQYDQHIDYRCQKDAKSAQTTTTGDGRVSSVTGTSTTGDKSAPKVRRKVSKWRGRPRGHVSPTIRMRCRGGTT